MHKLLARAIDELGIQDRTILISPVGCSVFAYYYFDVGNMQAAHGRAPAVATAVKRSRPDSIVLSYQGDGDLAAIGSAEILHAANRGENITVIFVNNAIYGMTGGQMAPTTLLGQKSTTTPLGRNPWNEGYPLHVSELLATLEAPVYIERVALGNNKQIWHGPRASAARSRTRCTDWASRWSKCSRPCPTIWKMDPVDAQRWVRDEMAKTFPLGVFRDRTKEAPAAPAPQPRRRRSTNIPAILGVDRSNETQPPAPAPRRATVAKRPTARLKIAGFGGQGVLLLGEVLAEAGLDAGLEVSWLPSYGPEMRSGTSNCHVRLSTRAHRFAAGVRAQRAAGDERTVAAQVHRHGAAGRLGSLQRNGVSRGLRARGCAHAWSLPFTQLADELGDGQGRQHGDAGRAAGSHRHARRRAG